MRLQYVFRGIDPLTREHLCRHVAFANIDLIFEARKQLGRIQQSRLGRATKYLRPSGNTAMMISLMESRQADVVDQVDKVFSFSLQDDKNGGAILELFASPEYFEYADQLAAAPGGRMLARFFQSRQKIIDELEKDLYSVYGLSYTGRIIEDDGKKLRVGVS